MEGHDLAKLIAEMRRCQKAYYRTRSGTDLAKSKAIEARVDKVVEGILRQPTLFGGHISFPSDENPSP